MGLKRDKIVHIQRLTGGKDLCGKIQYFIVDPFLSIAANDCMTVEVCFYFLTYLSWMYWNLLPTCLCSASISRGTISSLRPVCVSL